LYKSGILSSEVQKSIFQVGVTVLVARDEVNKVILEFITLLAFNIQLQFIEFQLIAQSSSITSHKDITTVSIVVGTTHHIQLVVNEASPPPVQFENILAII